MGEFGEGKMVIGLSLRIDPVGALVWRVNVIVTQRRSNGYDFGDKSRVMEHAWLI